MPLDLSMNPLKNAAFETLAALIKEVQYTDIEVRSTYGPLEAHISIIDEAVGSLDSLTVGQLITAWMYFRELPKRVEDNQLGQFIEADAWFFNLAPAQQDQVIAYGSSQNVGKHINMVPNWYEGYGHNGAFRFETPINHPVASR